MAQHSDPNQSPSRSDARVEIKEQRDGNSMMVSFDFKPGYESHEVPGRGTAVDWEVKFSREQGQRAYRFEPGELVRVDSFVERDEEGQLRLIAAWNPRSNADVFYLENTLNQDQLEALYGHEVVATVEIKGDRPKSEEEFFEPTGYVAELVQINSTALKNPDPDFIRRLPEQTYLVLEGEVTEMMQRDPGEREYSPQRSLRLRTDSGEEYKIQTGSYAAKITSHDMEHTQGKSVEVGDRVRIVTTVYDAGNKIPDYGNYLLGNNSAMPCTLLEPGEARTQAREALDDKHALYLKAASEALDVEMYQVARSALAEIRRSEPKRAVTTQIQAIVERLPEEEKPTFLSRSRHDIEVYREALGLNLEELTKSKFKDLVRGIFTGAVKESEDSSEKIYASNATTLLLNSNVPSEEQFQVLSDWADQLLTEIRAEDREGEDWKILNEYFNDLQSAFHAIGALRTDQGYTYIYDKFLEVVDHGEHKGSHWMKGNVAHAIVGMVRFISHHVDAEFAERYADRLERTLPSLRLNTEIPDLGSKIEMAVQSLREKDTD